MGLFDKLFKKKDTINNADVDKPLENPECQSLCSLKDYMDTILMQNHYIARSEYYEKFSSEKQIIDHFDTIKKSGLLDVFCEKNNFSLSEAENILSKYMNFETLIDEHNESFIQRKMLEEKQYLDSIFSDTNPEIKLDEEQRRVVLTDEDYCLAVAGAGAGKTTTIAAKVKYLVDKKGIAPSQILVVSFTNKAVKELQNKLNRDLSIDCPVTTFHSTGNAILRKQSSEKLNIVDSSKLYYVLQDYFKKSVLKNESLVNNLVLFFSSYFDAPYDEDDLNNFFNKISKSNFATMRSDFNEFMQKSVSISTQKPVTIQSEELRSYQEVEIANFLYLNNIDYEYEPIYKYNINSSKKPYTPDFIINQGDKTAYIEHFGISEDGKNNRFDEQQLEAYKKAMNDKINLHKNHGTKLICTFSQYKDGRTLLEHLREELEKNGFELHQRPNDEIIEKFISAEENRYIKKFVNLVCRFITNFKTNGFMESDFDRMYHSSKNVRTRLFIDICRVCYLEYERYLKENNAVDFQDMINRSARILKEVKEMKEKLDFKYIIVDEYQDISKQRFDLVTALSEVTDAKIVAVGDDWQSIYAFSGSDITLFTQFQEKMGYAKLLKIVNTYRNSQEIIDIAGGFIQKNESQIKKELQSPKNIDNPVIIYTYDAGKTKDNKKGVNYAVARAVEAALGQIAEFNEKEGKPENSSVLLLGRFGFDGDKLKRSGLFEYSKRGGKLKSLKYPKLSITFMTAHASKGLGYDNVIILNGSNDTYGFPSQIEDDPVLALVTKGDNSIDYAEERRLFYVAMTRTKNRVYFIAPEQNPSEFLLELKHDYENIVIHGSLNEELIKNDTENKICPMCGYPMKFRYKNAYGLRLYICTNEPEVCGFMTNEYKAGKLPILKCDKCEGGYLIVKYGKKNGYFLGCTNYKKDGTGCGNFISQQAYNKMLELGLDTPPENELLDNSEDISSQEENVKKPKTVMFKENNLNDVVYTVLKCLAHISEKRHYGTGVLTDVLQGVNNSRIANAEFNKLSEYGKLKNFCREDLRTIIEWLIENKFIMKTENQRYPVLYLTKKSKSYRITEDKLENLLEKLN